MAGLQIPLDLIMSRFNFGERFAALRAGPLSGRFSNLRPISEFLDFKRFSKPANFGVAQSRLNYNLSHYSSNYAVVIVLLSIYALLSNKLLLLDIMFVTGCMWLIGVLDGRDLELGTIHATTSQLYTFMLSVSVPIGLLASPFGTLMWLVGASGFLILGHASMMDRIDSRPHVGKYYNPARGKSARALQSQADLGVTTAWDWLGAGSSSTTTRVEELNTDDDVLIHARGRRHISDPLRFNGVDLGDGVTARRTSHLYASDDYENDNDDDDDDSTEDDEHHEGDGSQQQQLVLKNSDEALVQSAMRRIKRAREEGRKEVKLNKAELAAFEKQKKYMQEEKAREGRESRKAKDSSAASGSGERRKRKEREQRYSIPITELAAVSGNKKRGQPFATDVSLPKHPSPHSLMAAQSSQSQPGYPPMGYFPAPRQASSGSVGRPTSRPAPGSRSASPYGYDHIPGQLRPGSAAAAYEVMDQEEPWVPKLSSAAFSTSTHSLVRVGQDNNNPFQYQGPGAVVVPPYPLDATVVRRPASGPPGGLTDDDTESEEGSGGDRADEIVVEEDRAPRVKSSSSSKRRRSPSKRKPVGSSSSRKKK